MEYFDENNKEDMKLLRRITVGMVIGVSITMTILYSYILGVI